MIENLSQRRTRQKTLMKEEEIDVEEEKHKDRIKAKSDLQKEIENLKRNLNETSQANEKLKESADSSRKATSRSKRKNDISCSTSSNKRHKQLKLTFNINNFL